MGAMSAKSINPPSSKRLANAVRVRPQDLPADIVSQREAQWLGELETRLAAVQVWRGNRLAAESKRKAHSGN